MAKQKMKTETREKYSLYLDQADLDRLREYEREIGVPVSESVRRAVAAYVQALPRPKAIAKLFNQ